MKFAIIPWNENFSQDKIFGKVDPAMNHDERLTPFSKMQEEFERRGDCIHTVDLFGDPKNVDFFLFFERNDRWLKKLISWKMEYKAVYCNAEPPIVNPLHDKKNIYKLLNYYPYIMTWNMDLVDEKRFFKRNNPYVFKINIGTVPFEERKLLTSISGNKHSSHPDELYSERERIFTLLEEKYPDDFEFYGSGWEKTNHSAYCGRVENKAETYHHYRFALAFENMKNVRGYVTEKILDCLVAGIVPIYAGADDITDYVPQECFISYSRFKDPEEMIKCLKGITKEQYNDYLGAAQRFFHSEQIRKFDGEEYARDIYFLADQAQMQSFRIDGIHRIILNCGIVKNNLSANLKNALCGMKRKIIKA